LGLGGRGAHAARQRQAGRRVTPVRTDPTMAAPQEFRRIYILDRPSLADGPPAALVSEVGLEGAPCKVLPGGDRARVRRGSRTLEMNREGEIWFEDSAKLWNVTAPISPLPSRVGAETLALAWFE